MLNLETAAYSILNPHPMTGRKNAEGHHTTLVFTDRDGYTDLKIVGACHEAGLITLHSEDASGLPGQYGRTRVAYSIA